MSLIPLSFIITILVTPNIRNPALATNQPIVTATYITGLIAILTMIILAPLSSTALKIADVHIGMSGLEQTEVPLSIEFVGYFIRLFNMAVGVALCSLGVSTNGSLAGVRYSEL